MSFPFIIQFYMAMPGVDILFYNISTFKDITVDSCNSARYSGQTGLKNGQCYYVVDERNQCTAKIFFPYPR